MFFKSLSTHIRESNLFHTLIFSRQRIQYIPDPYLLTIGNPIYFRPLSTHIRNLMLQTITLGCNSLTLTSNPTLKMRQTFFALMFLLLFFFSHIGPIYFRPLSTHVRESNLFQTIIYSRHEIQCFKPSFIHPRESNAPNPNPYLEARS